MKAAGVIAEFNPFHSGHAYLLQEVRRRSACDALIVVMSGDFVQRGAPAIVGKYLRAEMALSGGADLVLELPCAGVLGSAGSFAEAGVRLLEQTGIVSELWFGSEAGDIRPFAEAAELLSQETEPFRTVLMACQATGMSYPKARMEAALAEAARTGQDPEGIRALLSRPNNLLGVEYTLALRRIGSSISPHTIRRAGAGYHEITQTEGFVSAAAVRQLLEQQQGEAPERIRAHLTGLVPPDAAAILADAASCGSLLRTDDFSEALFYRLLQETPETLQRYQSVSEDLANRICAKAFQAKSISELAELVKAKHLTRTGINRVLFRILLGMRTDDPQTDPTAACRSGIRVLGCRNGSPLIGELQARASSLVYLRTAQLPGEAFRTELFASRLYEWVRAKKAGERAVSEYHRIFLKV